MAPSVCQARLSAVNFPKTSWGIWIPSLGHRVASNYIFLITKHTIRISGGTRPELPPHSMECCDVAGQIHSHIFKSSLSFAADTRSHHSGADRAFVVL
jgi:hypothetical protein